MRVSTVELVVISRRSPGTKKGQRKTVIIDNHNRRRLSIAPSRQSPSVFITHNTITNSKMLRKVLDILYIVFVLALLFGIGTLDVIHWPVWSKAWVPEYMHRIEQFNIQKFNDPLSASLSVPNGWQSAMYLCEQMHLPFLLYFLFGKCKLPSLLFFTTRDFSRFFGVCD